MYCKAKNDNKIAILVISFSYHLRNGNFPFLKLVKIIYREPTMCQTVRHGCTIVKKTEFSVGWREAGENTRKLILNRLSSDNYKSYKENAAENKKKKKKSTAE